MFKAADFLSKADLRELHSEQRSLVDFLVVLRSEVPPPADSAPPAVFQFPIGHASVAGRRYKPTPARSVA